MCTVKTLLLCRVNPIKRGKNAYSEVYKDMYAGKAGKGKRYISLGNVDSFSLYPTIQGGPDSSHWFSGIYEDRKDIIFETKSDRSYHPIHLVANRQYDDTEETHTPFCIVTLLYGIKAKTCEGPLSFYEKQIEDIITDFKGKETNFPVYEIYNAVNICNAAIIWYTNDLLRTLKIVNQFGLSGHARKSFTLVGFAMNRSGEIEQKAISALQNSQDNARYYARIQGTIRDPDKYKKMLSEMKKVPDDPECGQTKDYTVFGQSDFSISLLGWKGEAFAKLLIVYLQQSELIASACWEIHTELMDKLNETGGPAEEPYSLLDQLLCSYQKIVDNYPAVKDFTWFGAFYELLCVHANIDRHPILHGPSSLFCEFLSIIYFYLADQNPATQEMLERSRATMQEVVRAWSVLTDQLLRIDDFTFHGFGNGSVLYNTLPECALDFYHAFLQRIVKMLVDIDHDNGRANLRSKYKYDFVMLPELKQGVSIQPILDVDAPSKREEGVKRQLWPQKQVYIVYFPVETVFSPLDFFAKLLHECFHHFGDTFRLREKRIDYICKYLAAEIMQSMDGKWDIKRTHTDIFCDPSVSDYIYTCLREQFIEEENEPNEDELKFYLAQGFETLNLCENEEKLRSIQATQIVSDFIEAIPEWDYYSGESVRLLPSINSILRIDGLQTLYKEGLKDIVFSSRLNKGQVKKALEFSESIRMSTPRVESPDLISDELIESCILYFKECYADLMMLLLLRLDARTYINFFSEDIQQALSNYRSACNTGTDVDRQIAAQEIASLSQRIAVVLSAYNYTEPIAQDPLVKDTIHEIVTGLKKPEYAPNLDNNICLFIPPMNALEAISNYLCEVVKEFKQFWESNKPENDALRSELNSIQTAFMKIFRNGEFLSNRFFEIISEYTSHAE